MQSYLSKIALTYLVLNLKNKQKSLSEEIVNDTITIVFEFLIKVENYEFLFSGVVDTLQALGY